MSNWGYTVTNLTETGARFNISDVGVDVIVDRRFSRGGGGDPLPATAG